MTDQLSELYQDLLTSTYDCVDRIVLNGNCSVCYSPGGFRSWWRQLHDGSEEELDNAHLMRMAGRFSRRVRGYAKANAIPIIDCGPDDRKHEKPKNISRKILPSVDCSWSWSRERRPLILWAEDVGATTLQWWAALWGLPSILPAAGKRRRWRAPIEQVLIIGARALPMAGTMSLCIGFVLALQGAAELRRFGGLNYVADLVAVAFTRALGALITAIGLSGRSASAISAEVATMVVTEEMDALRVMGLNPA